MAWWDKPFTPEYDAVQSAIGAKGFSAPFSKLQAELAKGVGATGFEPSGAQAFDALRSWVSTPRPGEPPSADEATRILDAASASPLLDPDERRRAAAIKTLRHVYMAQQRGGHSSWIVSLPLDFRQWPREAFRLASPDAVKALLRSNNERFSKIDIDNLSAGMLSALRWSQKAQVVLGALNGSGQAKADALDLLKTWFGDGIASDAQVAALAPTLRMGFNIITAALNRNQVILTDFVPIRGAAYPSDEYDFLTSEAFVFGLSGRERLDVIYVEEDFFNAGNVLKGQANWARILVHEMSHLCVGTDDMGQGAQTRYCGYGIKPNANFPMAEAIRNAENWAFFAADCAGALGAGEKARALRVI
ncbi:MAG TPA: M35 family metallo-endopeptidase [Burkholderiaceae bacterium]